MSVAHTVCCFYGICDHIQPTHGNHVFQLMTGVSLSQNVGGLHKCSHQHDGRQVQGCGVLWSTRWSHGLKPWSLLGLTAFRWNYKPMVKSVCCFGIYDGQSWLGLFSLSVGKCGLVHVLRTFMKIFISKACKACSALSDVKFGLENNFTKCLHILWFTSDPANVPLPITHHAAYTAVQTRMLWNASKSQALSVPFIATFLQLKTNIQ